MIGAAKLEPPSFEVATTCRLGYLPFERRSAHLFFQLVARRYERGSLLITTNQVVTQWGAVFGDEVAAAAILFAAAVAILRFLGPALMRDAKIQKVGQT